MATCQVAEYRGQGRGRPGINIPCEQDATHLYVNGPYRRLECDHHAAMTRVYIRPGTDPDAPTLTPLTEAEPAPPSNGAR